MVKLIELKLVEPSSYFKNLGFRDVLQNVLGLIDTEVDILQFLLNNVGNGYTCEELCKVVGKSRSTVERCVKKLVQLGLIKRRPVLSRNGGYTYIYFIDNPHRVINRVEEFLNEFYKQCLEVLNECRKNFGKNLM